MVTKTAQVSKLAGRRARLPARDHAPARYRRSAASALQIIIPAPVHCARGLGCGYSLARARHPPGHVINPTFELAVGRGVKEAVFSRFFTLGIWVNVSRLAMLRSF